MARRHTLPAATADTDDERRWIIIGATTIVLLTLIAYAPAITAGFIWDDDAYLTNNPLMISLDGLRQMWIPRRTPQYYPMVFTSFWVEHKLWGLQPAGFHVVNILLHATNALLVWRLCAMLKIPGAWLASAVFALHPVAVESVAWITERKNLLSGLFYLSAAMMYLRFDGERDGRETAGVIGRNYAVSFVLFVLALLSKTVTCSLPAALVLMMLWQRKRLTLGRLIPLVPFFVIGLAMGLHTAMLEREYVGASGEMYDFSFIERVLIASRALLFYPMKILLPLPLTFIYPRWAISTTSLIAWLPVVMVLIMSAGCVVMYVRSRRGLPLALAFYAGTVFPALGFFNVYPMAYSFVADHFQYLASLGVLVPIVAGISQLTGNAQRLTLVAAGLLPLLAGLTMAQTLKYRDAETLWRATLIDNPESWMVRHNLGKALLERGAAAQSRGERQLATALVGEGMAHVFRAMDLHPPLREDVMKRDPATGRLYNAYKSRQHQP